MSEVDEILDDQADRASTVTFSDDDLALRFTKRHEDELRYTEQWHKWHRWNGAYWREDATLEVPDLARRTCREVAVQMNGDGKKVASAKTVSSVVTLAKADRRHAATVDQWDRDPWLIGTPAGTVDLRTDELRPHSISDHITKVTAVTPGGECPLWDATLTAIFDGDKEMVDYVHRAFGYGLTGLTREEKLFLLFGDGSNGKGTMTGTIAHVIGDYAVTVAMNTLLVTRNTEHPTEIAKLRGSRIALAGETNDGARWNVARIKDLTGGDRLTGRFMRCDFFDFVPSHKLFVSVNRKPLLGRVDNAIKRRIELWPFDVIFDQADTTLKERLVAEGPGILKRLIDGCLDWQRNGLRPPEKVRIATAEYLSSMDATQLFIDDCCKMDAQACTSMTTLYAAWASWCASNGEFAGSKKMFTQEMLRRFDEGPRTHNIVHIIGIRMANELDDMPPVANGHDEWRLRV